MPVQHLSENPFGASIAHLRIAWEPPLKFDDAMIEQWNARFQRHCHASAVDFSQNIVWQIGDKI